MPTTNGRADHNRNYPRRRPGTNLSVGAAADALDVAVRTVTRWFDAGDFPGGWRINGATGDRRIPLAGLTEFCRRRGRTLDLGAADPRPVLLAVGVPPELAAGLAAQLPAVQVRPVADAFSAGAAVAALNGTGLAAAVVNAHDLGSDVARQVVGHLAGLAPHVTVLVAEDDDGSRWAGCAAVKWPATAAAVAGAVTAERVAGAVLNPKDGQRRDA